MRDIVLPCRAVGDPPPTVKWMKERYRDREHKAMKVTNLADNAEDGSFLKT